MTTTQGARAAQFIPFEKVKRYIDGNIPIVPLKANGDPHTSYLYENDAEKNIRDKDTLLNAEPSNFSRIRHVESPGRNVKKHPIPPRRPVYTAAKVSMAGFTVRGLENEISYVQQDWPLVALKELGDNPYDFFKEFYSDSPKEHRGIAYNVWQPYPGNPDSAEYFIIRIAATSSNIDNRNVFEDLQLIFDLTKYCTSKRGQYKGGTGELGDALKRMLKMGYASWIGHSVNQGKPDLQWKEPMILTFNKKRYNVLLHVDTEIDEAKVIISQDHDAVIESTDTVVSVALPACISYHVQVDRLRQYYNIYRIPKIRTNFSFIEGIPPA